MLFWRAAPRTSSRLVTFAQAINRMKIADACHTIRNGPTPMSWTDFASVITFTFHPRLVCGSSRASRRGDRGELGLQVARLPAGRKPRQDHQGSAGAIGRRLRAEKLSGVQISLPNGKSNRCGATPTTV